MRGHRWVAVGVLALALRASAAQPAPARPEPPAEAGLNREAAAALAVWVDDDVTLSGKGARFFEDGFAESARGTVSGALMALGMRVVSSERSPHDAVARLSFVELERHSGILKDYDTGTLAIELEGDGHLLAEARRRFTTRPNADMEIRAAVAELAASPALARLARERGRARAPAVALEPPASGAPGGAGAARRVAVLELRGPFGPAVLSGIADEARGAIAESLRPKGVSVMTRESMAVVLKEMGKSAAACTEGECEVETGRMIGADLVVTGEVIEIERTYVLILKLHETAGGTLLATRQARGKDGLAIIDAVKPAAASLFR